MHRLSRLSSLTFAALFAAATLTSVAKAGTITTFNVVGTFDSGSKLSGTITIDTTVGSVMAANLALTSPYNVTFTTVDDQEQNYGRYYDLVTLNNGSYSLYLVFLSNTLLGYQGGDLGVDGGAAPATDIARNNQFVENLHTGSAVAAATPEPSSVILLDTGLLGGAGTCLRRLRAARAA